MFICFDCSVKFKLKLSSFSSFHQTGICELHDYFYGNKTEFVVYQNDKIHLRNDLSGNDQRANLIAQIVFCTQP